MKNDIFDERLLEIRKKLRKDGFDSLVLSNRSDVRYITGFEGDDSWAVVVRGSVYLITDSRYTIMARRRCGDSKIVERTGPMTTAVADILNRFSSVKKIAIDDRTEIRFFNDLAKKVSAKLKAAPSPVGQIRMVKDSSEISAMKRAAKIAHAALDKTLAKVYFGISESAFAAMLDLEIKNLASVPAFETIVAFGPNSAVPHHIPTMRKLKKNDTVLIDFGAKHKGYCSDITRCFAVGRVSEFYSKVYHAVFAAQSAAIKAAAAGRETNLLDNAAKDVLKAAKLPSYGHGTGHGLGLDVHEGPNVFAASKEKLVSRNVVTVEPGVYLAGKFGIRIEDDIVITEKGSRILTCRLKTDQVPVLKILSTKS